MAYIMPAEDEQVWKLRHSIVIASRSKPPLWLRLFIWFLS